MAQCDAHLKSNGILLNHESLIRTPFHTSSLSTFIFKAGKNSNFRYAEFGCQTELPSNGTQCQTSLEVSMIIHAARLRRMCHCWCVCVCERDTRAEFPSGQPNFAKATFLWPTPLPPVAGVIYHLVEGLPSQYKLKQMFDWNAKVSFVACARMRLANDDTFTHNEQETTKCSSVPKYWIIKDKSAFFDASSDKYWNYSCMDIFDDICFNSIANKIATKGCLRRGTE